MKIQDWDKKIRIERPLIVEGVNIASQEELSRYYARQFCELGATGRAFAYPEEELYQAKLDQYRRILEHLILSSDSVLDVGCGFGSLLEIIGNCHYKGVDLVPDLVEEAKRRYPKSDFSVGDVADMTDCYDWVIGLGITGTVPEPARLVFNMWLRAGKGMVLDFINQNRYVDDLNCYDIGQCLEMFCQWGAGEVKIHSFNNYIWAIFEIRRT